MRYVAYPIAAILVLAAAHLGLTRALGAHPFWDTRIAWIGVPIGLVAAFALSRAGAMLGSLAALAALIATGAAAHFGKLEFAASFAENATAGRFWYFGWIGVAASITALIASLAARR